MWRDESACEATVEAMHECYDAGMRWGRDVHAWLERNLPAGSAAMPDLPEMPTFEYALALGGTQLDLTRRLRDAFELAMRSVRSPTDRIMAGVSFHEPVPTASLGQLVPALDPEATVTLAGTFDPTGAAISGTKTAKGVPTIEAAVELFYQDQIALADERILEFRFQLGQTLWWYCGDDKEDRSFEAENKVYPSQPRWSTDWPSEDYGVRHLANIPKPYVDDIGAGDRSDPNRPQEYPDFAIGSASGREFRYRKVYYTRYTTNCGETNNGTVVFRGQNGVRPSNSDEWAYCNVIKGGRRGSCCFAEHTTCLKYRSIDDPSSGLHVDWRTRPDDGGLCHSPTD